jgi:hypothetical protein
VDVVCFCGAYCADGGSCIDAVAREVDGVGEVTHSLLSEQYGSVPAHDRPTFYYCLHVTVGQSVEGLLVHDPPNLLK